MRSYTVAEIEANFSDFASTYSDLFKDLNGFRPRGALVSASLIAQFLNSYDEELERVQQRDAEELAHLSEQYGREFASWHDYYDHREQLDNEAHTAWLAERTAKLAHAREFARRGSPMPHIIAWEHGDRNASCARA